MFIFGLKNKDIYPEKIKEAEKKLEDCKKEIKKVLHSSQKHFKDQKGRREYLKNQLNNLNQKLKNEKDELKKVIGLIQERKVRLDFIYDTYPFLHIHKCDDKIKAFRRKYRSQKGEEEEKNEEY